MGVRWPPIVTTSRTGAFPDVAFAGRPPTLADVSETPTCPRHPDVETRLSCSACGELICPSCGREAAVGYKCPDCARQDGITTRPREGSSTSPLSRWLSSWSPGTDDDAPASRPADAGDGLPLALGARATVVAAAAAVAAGLLIGPVLAQGAFFLISAGVLGWVVARAVYWATEERNSPYVRALAMTAAGVMVLVGQVSASTGPDTVRELALLAYPAALYGGWIVVRQR